MKYLPRVLRYLRPYWRLAVLSVILMAVGSLVALLVPWPLQILVDNVLGTLPLHPRAAAVFRGAAADRYHLLVAVVAGGFLLVLLQHGLTVVSNYVNVRIEQNMVLDFRSDLFQHAQRLSLAFHDQKRSGMLIYAVNFQGDAAARLVMTIPPLAQSALTLTGMFWIVFTIDRTLALLSLTVIPFLVYSVRHYTKHIQSRLQKVLEMEGESLSIVHEAISMLRVIVAFGREDHEHRRFVDQGRRAVGERVKVTVRQTLFTMAVNTITAGGTAIVLGYGAHKVIQGQLTVGQLLVVMGYIAAVYNPLETISTTIGSLQDVFLQLKLAFDLADIQPEIRDAPGAVDIGRAAGHVRFEHVNFSYSGRADTLTDVSFEAKPGQVVAIVGPTGAGKSTTVSLIPRFYAPQSGRILIDGRDSSVITLKSLRAQVSVVLQEPLLFSGTIAENIRYGRLEATTQEVLAAARAANAHDFVSQLPDGYDTVVGERGAKLSGGERQRISVARAFLRNAPILILDEPTSSIDSKTEAVILDALDRLMAGRTTFMIAHRLATIRRADQILVVDRGRIVEHGTHEQLLEHRGLYHQLHDMQTRQRKDPIEAAAEDGAAEREFERSTAGGWS
jgi:ATP-binding cassette subfamily B protein/subfamily B ATP-binding cassette protein MsbA